MGDAGQAGQRVKLVYIVGMFRSGTTVLGDLLGQAGGCFHVGELHLLWGALGRERYRCGCGDRLKDCGFWRDVLQDAYGPAQAPDVPRIRGLIGRGLRTRHVVLLNLLPWVSGLFRRPLRNMGEYAAELHRVYAAVAGRTGSHVVIDSSKWPAIAYALMRHPGADVHLIHVVRDARAVTHSWLSGWRSAGWRDGGGRRQGRLRALFHWVLWNNVVWHFWNQGIATFERRWPRRYHLLRYEDFMADPGRCLASLQQEIGEVPAGESLVSDGAFDLRRSHTVGGNPNRFRRGRVSLRVDDRWRSEMSPAVKVVSTLLSWPALRAFGYRLASPAPAARR